MSSALQFTYENWRGDTHVYVIDPEKIEWGPYDGSGLNREAANWVLHGKVITRDGDPRPEMAGRRRTFLMGKIRDLSQVVIDR